MAEHQSEDANAAAAGKRRAEQLRKEIANIKSGRPARSPAEFTEIEAQKKAQQKKQEPKDKT
jgi:hypothetical protein